MLSKSIFTPGRAEFIGNHEDWNSGKVIAVSIELGIQIQAQTNPTERRVSIQSSYPNSHGKRAVLKGSYELGKEQPGNYPELRYFESITWALCRPEIQQELGFKFDFPAGYSLNCTSNLPLGAGLGSSAAIEVAHLRAIQSLFPESMSHWSPTLLARIAQRAENLFVGAPTGLMDQLTIAHSSGPSTLVSMDFADPDEPEVQKLEWPEELQLLIYHSGVDHHLSEALGEESYTKRKEEIKIAKELINSWRRFPIQSLRELGLGDLASAEVQSLPEKLFRRVRHVVEENIRVDRALSALQTHDWQLLGQLLNDSGNSSRELFEVTTAEIDFIVESFRKHGALGARLTGGGFGGAVMAIGYRKEASRILQEVHRDYRTFLAEATEAQKSGWLAPLRSGEPLLPNSDLSAS